MADLSSLYPAPPQQQTGLLNGNPLQLIEAIGGLNRNALFQQEFNARKAIGNAYQQAIDPATGNIDTPRLMRAIQGNPDAGFLAGEASAGALSRQGQAIQNATAATNLATTQHNYIANSLGSFATDPNATKNDAISRLVALKRNIPSLPSDMIAQWASDINRIDDSTAAGKAALRAKLGQIRDFAIGSTGLATQIPGQNPISGAPTTTPVGTVLSQSAQSLNPPPAAAPAPTGTPGSVVMGPDAGGAASATKMQADLSRAGNFQQEIFPYQQALQKIQELGPGGVGPGTKGRQAFASFVYTAAPGLSRWIPGINPGDLTKYDEAKKYLTQATMTRLAGMGHGTDQQLATALTGNPNVEINDMAAEDLTKMAIATRRMEHAQTMIASKAGPAGYTAASAKFAGSQDPRAYAIDMMKPEQIEELKKSLKGADRTKFNRSLAAAIEAGVISPQKSQ